jgi:hypothetical protein
MPTENDAAPAVFPASDNDQLLDSDRLGTVLDVACFWVDAAFAFGVEADPDNTKDSA